MLERREDHVLRDFVDVESRNYKGERFNRFIIELQHRIKVLIQRWVGVGGPSRRAGSAGSTLRLGRAVAPAVP